MKKSIHHSFDVEIAEKVGVSGAVLVHHFQYWIELNRKGKRNLHDGKYWTYQTMKDIANTFTYWTERQIERLIGKLIKNKVLVKGNYNKTPFDRTVWYAFYDEEETVKCISPNGEMEETKGGNGKIQTGKCINNDTDTITNDKTDKEKQTKEKQSKGNTPNPSRGSLPPPSFPSSQSHKKKPKALKIRATKKDTTPKDAYGEDKCVLLTKEQYQKIVPFIGEESQALQLIEEMNDWMQRTGKTYKSHYHALRKWHKTNQTEQKEKQNNKKDSKLRGWEEKDEDDDWQPKQATAADFQ